jgi:hypothetical protein
MATINVDTTSSTSPITLVGTTQWDRKVTHIRNAYFMNMPTGMVEHTDDEMRLFTSTDDDFTIFYMNILYRLNPTYTEEYDEWDHRSTHSLYYNWNGPGRPFPITNINELCATFEKMMTHYVYLEYQLNQHNRRNNNSKTLLMYYNTITQIIGSPAFIAYFMGFMIIIATLLIWKVDSIVIKSIIYDDIPCI